MSGSVPTNLKARVKESYDAIAETYASQFTRTDDPTRLGYIQRLVENLQASGRSSANVLELGCGSGVPATKSLLQNKEIAFRVIGNDLSTTQLALARSNLAEYGDKVTLLEGDMLSLEFPNESFDAVTGFYSIVHLPREEQKQLMLKIVAWLKPGGLFLANFGAEELPTHETDRWLDHDKGWMFWAGWGKSASIEMVLKAGMEKIFCETHQDPGDAEFVWILAKKLT